MDFPCKKCYQVLKRPYSFKDHNRRFHPNAGEEPIKCSFCDKRFSRLHDMKRHTSKQHYSPSEMTNKFMEAVNDDKFQEENKISEPCLNNELNNDDKNYEEMENEDNGSFESNKRDDNPTINKDAKSIERSGNLKTCVDFEQSSNIVPNSEDENVLLSYEEMETKETENSETNTEIDIPEILTESYKNTFNVSNEIQCNFCSKSFKYRNCLRRHINTIHKDQQRNIVGLKDEQDILEIRESLNNHTGFILKNADNILELMNTQNQQNDQIKKIKDFLFCDESNKKVFGCSLCNKYFSSKGSLYTHKSRYHKQSTNEKAFKCEKCDDSFENTTNLAIHNYRSHRASL